MIEKFSDCNRFQEENVEGDWIVHVVPVKEGVHPTMTSPSILFIRNIYTGKTYYFSFNHPDSIPEVTHARFVNDFLLRKDNIKWALDKKFFSQLLNLPTVYDANLCGYLSKNEIFELSEFDTPAHALIRRNAYAGNNNRAIPLMKHLESFNDMCESIEKMIDGYSTDNRAFCRVNNIILSTLGDVESNGIHVDRELFLEHFDIDCGSTELAHSQYNIYTATGRPSNRFSGVNYAALNQTDGARRCFTSRYGKDGRMVIVDYTAFHPRIICHLTDYKIPIETDIYEYLAQLYFSKKDVDETDIKEAKKLTFRQLYGGVEEKYSHIKYLSNLKTYIDTQWEFFQKNGYVETPIFKRRITDKHITDPSPSKVFNYILQAVEGEIAISKLQDVQAYLLGKKTKAVLYTYDAILYDFYKDDGIETLNEIRNIMSFNSVFPMKTYIGESYHDVKLVTI